MSDPRPFPIDVPQATLDDIARRVERYPWDDLHDLGSWQAGPPAAFLRRVADRWLGGYDWRAAEAALNAVPGVLVDVDGIAVHALQERGSGSDPATVVLVHGWPSTVWDFARMIDPLAHPERHGGDAEDGVTVVVPSMAGFGWSGRPPYPMGLRAQAGLLHRAVTEGLGHDRYVVQGGDFGATVAGWLALDHPEAVRGIHVSALNLRPAGAPYFATDPPASYTEEERDHLRGELAHLQAMFTYALVQARPMTLAAGLMDSPVGQAAWILEKFHDWTALADGQDPDAVYDLDDLLTTVMIYLVTRSFDTSLWVYAGLFGDPAELEPGQRTRPPVAYLDAHDPLVPAPLRSIPARVHDLVRWTELPAEVGTHFPALAHPDLLRVDLQAFLADLPR